MTYLLIAWLISIPIAYMSLWLSFRICVGKDEHCQRLWREDFIYHFILALLGPFGIISTLITTIIWKVISLGKIEKR